MSGIVKQIIHAVALAAVNIVSRPSLTIPIFLPLSYLCGRFNLVHPSVAISTFGALIGLLILAMRRPKEPSGEGVSSYLEPPSSSGDGKEFVRGRLESAEWLNAAVRLVWKRYPTLVAEWLRQDIVDEILEGIRRDKLFPAAGGAIRDIIASKIVLRDSTPWIMDIKLNQMRSTDELSVTGRVRFVSDKDAGVELSIKCAGGINIPVKIEDISVETWLNVRVHVKDRFPFVRVVWISMLEKPKLDLSIRPMSGFDVMHIPGLDLILHDLIMTAIEHEIVFPTGKIVPVEKGLPDEYYFEYGPRPTHTDSYAGIVTLFVHEVKGMLHTANTLVSTKNLYVRVQMGSQVFRSTNIVDILHDKLHDRFELLASLGAEEALHLELVCEESDGTIMYTPTPLGEVRVKDVLHGKWSKPVWVNVPAMTNSSIMIQCTYAPFQRSLKTVTTQHNNSKEFIGGMSDMSPEEVARGGEVQWPGQAIVRTEVDRCARRASVNREASAGGGAEMASTRTVSSLSEEFLSEEKEEEEEEEGKRPLWGELLPRSTYKGVVWVTIHEAAELQPKIIGTRDPYVRLKMNSQTELTTAMVDTTHPTWEQELCLLVRDTVNDELELHVLQNDVAMGRHVTDDSIGTYTFNMKQLISDKPAQNGQKGLWSGWVSLMKVKRGRVRLTMRWEMLPDAIQEAKEQQSDRWDIGMGIPVAISKRPPTGLYGILQVVIMRGKGIHVPGKRTSHPFVTLQLGDQKLETRVVRSTLAPVFNEYFEMYVKDPLKERLEIRIESKDLMLSEKIGHLKLPIVHVARGKLLQEWMSLSDKSTAKLLVEIRLCNFSYPNQERAPSTRFDMLLEKAEQMQTAGTELSPHGLPSYVAYPKVTPKVSKEWFDQHSHSEDSPSTPMSAEEVSVHPPRDVSPEAAALDPDSNVVHYEY